MQPTVRRTAVAALCLIVATALAGLALRDPRPVVLSLAGLGLVGATLLWPGPVVLAVLFLLYGRLSDVYGAGWGPLTLNQLAVGAVLLALLLRRWMLRRAAFAWDPVLGWMLVYGAAILLSCLAALDRVATLAALMAYLRDVFIVLALVSLVTTMAGLRRATWTLVAVGVLLAAGTLFHALTGNDLAGLSSLEVGHIVGDTYGAHYSGTIRDANDFGQMLVPLVALALYRAWGERHPALRLAGLLAVALMVEAIVLTFSRGGALALAAVLLGAITLQRFRPARLLVLGLALGPVLLAAPRPYWERLGATAQFVVERSSDGSPARSSPAEDRPDVARVGAAPTESPPGPAPGEDRPAIARAGAAPTESPPGPAPGEDRSDVARADDSLDKRSRVWRVGAQMALEHPLTGVGKGNYDLQYPHYVRRVDPALPPTPKVAHSTPVQILADTGLLGLVTFAIPVAVALAGLRRAGRRLMLDGLGHQAMLLEAVELGIYGYLVASLFLSDSYPRSLWLMVGLAIIGHRAASRLDPGEAAGLAGRLPRPAAA